jgi:hypothetical protein
MIKRASIIAALLLASVAALFSEEKNPLVTYYDSEFMNVNFNMFGGLQLAYQGQVSGTQMGISRTMKETLSKYSDTRNLVNSYFTLNLLGNTFVYGGLAAILASPFIMQQSLLSSASSSSSSSNTDLGFLTTFSTIYYVYLGGLAASMVGSFILPSSYEKLLQGVTLFNRHKISEYK